MSEISLFRYHDLSQRIAVFATDGGSYLRGDTEDVQIDPEEAEVALHQNERELARFAGAIQVVGPRTTSPSDDAASLGLVLDGGGLLLVTTERLVVMALRGTSQLGAIGEGELHTFALPWDLVDTVAIAEKPSMTDRIAGARTVEIFGGTTMVGINLTPVKRAEIDGEEHPIRDDEVMSFLACAGAAHRISVSPPADRERLQAIIDGRFERSDGERIAMLTQEKTASGLAPHLEGRVRAAATDGIDTPPARACPNCSAPTAPEDRFCGECGARLPDAENTQPTSI